MNIEFRSNCNMVETSIPVFSTESYLKCKSKECGYVFGVHEGKDIFFLPYIIKRKFILAILEFQTATVWIDSSYKKYEKNFLDTVVNACFKKLNIDFICQNPAYAIFDEVPTTAQYSKFGSYIVNLKLSEETLWGNIHSKHRNVIRNAEKNSVDIDSGGKYWDQAYRMISDTQSRSQRGFFEKDMFIHLLKNLEEQSQVFVCLHRGEIQGCAVILYDKKKAYYLFGGSAENPFLGSINLMQWNIIKFFKQKGLSEYDFVGARLSEKIEMKLQGIQRFKKRFGGELYTGYLWKAINRKWKYNLYKKIVCWKNKNPFIDAIDDENTKG